MSPRALLALALLFVLAVDATVGPWAHQAMAVGPSAPNQMALDTDLTSSGVQASRTITGNGQFSIGIFVTVDATPYRFYQWELRFPTAGLGLDGMAENTAGTGLTDCNPSGTSFVPPDQTDLYGASCGLTQSGATTSYTGLVTTIFMRCLADGTYDVQLPEYNRTSAEFGTSLLDTFGYGIDTGTNGATITCVNVGAPASPTPTPIVPTPTPRPPGPNTFSLDAEPTTAGIQGAVTELGSDPFSIDIAITALGSAPYQGYSWLLQLPPSGLAFLGAVEHTADTSLTVCGNPVVPQNSTAIYSGCGGRQSITFVGVTTTAQLACLGLGTYTVSLMDMAGNPLFGTTLIDHNSNSIPTTVGPAITITCAPPATATATSSATPTATSTPTSVPIRVGGVADVHVGGDPARASADRSRRGFGYLAMISAAILALTVAGVYLRRRRRA